MGDVCGHCGVGVAGGCSCGPDSPQGCPAIRPLQMGEYLRPSRDRADRQRVAGRMARKGALQSGPYGGVCVRCVSAKFRAARMCLRAGRAPPLRVRNHLRPSRNRADRQRVAGRIARKGALQSGPYGGVCVRHQSARFRAARMFLRAGRAPPLQIRNRLRPLRDRGGGMCFRFLGGVPRSFA